MIPFCLSTPSVESVMHVALVVDQSIRDSICNKIDEFDLQINAMSTCNPIHIAWAFCVVCLLFCISITYWIIALLILCTLRTLLCILQIRDVLEEEESEAITV
jgi:hypothetical protein